MVNKMERLRYKHYKEFQEIVEKELANKTNLIDYESWVTRLANNLNGNYHPNDLMKLFVFATDCRINIPVEYKCELQQKALDALRDWVVQHPVKDRKFTKICMEFLGHPTEVSSFVVQDIIDILRIMGVDLRGEHKSDEDWLDVINYRFGTWKTKDGRVIREVIPEIIKEAKVFELTELCKGIIQETKDVKLSGNVKVREFLAIRRADPNIPNTIPKRVSVNGN